MNLIQVLPGAHVAYEPRSKRHLLHALSLVGLVLIAASASAQQRPRVEHLFERMDRNANGVIDEQELKDARRATFERADANGDDYVDGDELSELADELEDLGGGRRGALVRQRLEQRGGGGDRLERIDTDRDGRISEAEFVAAPSPLLRLDRDSDGRITRAEMERRK